MVRSWQQPTPLEYDDYGQYLLHAQAIIEGRPYADVGYLATPYAPEVGPPLALPGLPLTLVPLLRFAPSTHWMPKALMFAALALFLFLAGRSLWAIEPVVAAAAVLMSGTALLLANAPLGVGSDLPFAALLWGLVLIADRPGPWTVGRTVFFVLVGTWAFLYRLVAVALLPALVIFWVLHRRRSRWWPLVPLLAFAGIFYLQFFVIGIGQFQLPSGGNTLTESLADKWHIIIRNVMAYRVAFHESQLYPTPVWLGNAVYHAITSLVALGGVSLWVWRARSSFAPLLAVSYMALLLWVGFYSGRYAWPLFPVSAFGLFLGLQVILRFRSRTSHNPDRSVYLTAVVLCALAVGFHRTLEGERQPTVADTRVQALLDEVRSLGSENPDVRIGYFKPRSLTWFTGVPAMPLFVASDTATFGELRRYGITHVALGSLGLSPDLTARWHQLVAANPGTFDRVWANEGFQIYQVRSTDRPIGDL